VNLIHDPWIPIRRRSGGRELIAPWQLSEHHDDDPVLAVNSPRADFDGALMQFLIGLLQTALPPEDFDAWIDGYESPPAPEALREAMARHADAFELFGDGPRFMQDNELSDGEPKEIAALLVEAPGGNTLKNNLDHFIKRGGTEALCPACAAAALYCLQTNAPSGGVGHRTSLRGGGPLTTLVVADPRADETGFVASLWRNVWLNVLELDTLQRQSGNPARNRPADIFPWLAATRTSEAKTGRPTTPEDVHPLQMYWGTPRRIRLLPARQTAGVCDICGSRSEHLHSSYLTKNYGVNYEGPWRHPLSPHLVDKDGVPLPAHPQPGGLPYRHWLGIVQGADSKPLEREPARVVRTFWEQRAKEIKGQYRVWAFGYDMDNMKARCWYESTIPLYQLSPELRPAFEDNIGKLIFAAAEVANNLRNALKKAWFRRPQEKNGDTSFATAAFWQRTEGGFYATLAELQTQLPDDTAAMRIRERWLRDIGGEALQLFDQWALSGPIEDSDPRRITRARRELQAFNRSGSLLGGLGLPTPKQKRAAAAAQGEPA
jgi:CRISPR system Cascade subunit CasA